MGSGGRGTTGGNTSSFGSANGRGGMGQNGAGGVNQPQFNQFGSVGSQIGQGSFVGRSDNAGRFVGQAQSGQQQSMSRFNFGGLGGRGGRTAATIRTSIRAIETQNTRRIRPQLKLGFSIPPMATPAVSNTLAVRLTAAQPSLGSVENVNLKLDDAGVVTLTGRVQSQEAKSLAAAILRLEPGVRKVVNELEVTPEPPAAGNQLVVRVIRRVSEFRLEHSPRSPVGHSVGPPAARFFLGRRKFLARRRIAPV